MKRYIWARVHAKTGTERVWTQNLRPPVKRATIIRCKRPLHKRQHWVLKHTRGVLWCYKMFSGCTHAFWHTSLNTQSNLPTYLYANGRQNVHLWLSITFLEPNGTTPNLEDLLVGTLTVDHPSDIGIEWHRQILGCSILEVLNGRSWHLAHRCRTRHAHSPSSKT